jgi:hypothetical protein
MSRKLARFSLWLTALCLSACVAADLLAGEAGGPEKKAPPPRPLMISVWTAFQGPPNTRAAPAEALTLSDTRPETRWRQGYARRGEWLTVWVELRNTTAEDTFRGSISTETESGRAADDERRPFRTEYYKEFEIGPRTVKRIRFGVLFPENGWSKRSQFRLPLKISSSGGQSDERAISIHDVTQECLIAVLSDTPGAYRWLATARGGGALSDVADSTAEEINLLLGSGDDSLRDIPRRVTHVPPEELPDRARELAAADLIILDGPPRTPLTDAQYAALFDYCLAGGRLLITAGREPARLKAGERRWSVERLAGVRVESALEVGRLDLMPPFIPEPHENWSLPMLATVLAKDAVGEASVWRDAERGKIQQVTRSLGRGAVVFLPFPLGDKALATWEGRTLLPLNEARAGRRGELFPVAGWPEFARGVLDDGDETPRADRPVASKTISRNPETLRTLLDESFAKDTPVETPRPPLVLAFLFFYLLAAVPLNYLLFGKWKRREIAWAAVPFWAILFTGLAYFFGVYGRLGKLTVNEVSVIETSSGSPYGAARTFLGLYTPRRGDYAFDFAPDAQAAPGHLEALLSIRGLSLPKLVLHDGDEQPRVAGAYVGARDTRRLEIRHRAELGGGITAQLLSPAPDGKRRMLLRNLSGRELVNPVLLIGDRAWPLFPTGAWPAETDGEAKAFTLKAPSLEHAWPTADEAFFGKEAAFSTVRQTHVLDRLRMLRQFVGVRRDKHETMLVAWLEGPVLPLSVNREEPGRMEGLSLLLMPLTDAALESAAVTMRWCDMPFIGLELPAQVNWKEPGPNQSAEFDPRSGSCIFRLRPVRSLVGMTDPLLQFDFSLVAELQADSVVVVARGASGARRQYVPVETGAAAAANEARVTDALAQPEATSATVANPAGLRKYHCVVPLTGIWRGADESVLLQVELKNPRWTGAQFPSLALRMFQAKVTGRPVKVEGGGRDEP